MAEPPWVSRKQVKAAAAAVRRGGTHLIRAQSGVRWRLKKDGTFVTDLDGQIQRSLRASLRKVFPGCVFVGEEDASASRASRIRKARLVLDPIDGTAAFARGLNFYSISLAVIDDDGEPRVGIVHMPLADRWYAGAREASGWVSYAVTTLRQNVRIRRAPDGKSAWPAWRLEDSYLYVSSDAHRQLDLATFQGKIRALGPSASHLAMLLDRTPDPCAVVLTQYRIWDAVAGLALARAAGFEIRDLRRPNEPLEFPRYVNELVSSGHSPPILVGQREMMAELTRTVIYRNRQP